MELDNKKIMKDKETLGHLTNRAREELELEIAALQEENKRYLETIIKNSKSNADAVLKGQTPRLPTPDRA